MVDLIFILTQVEILALFGVIYYITTKIAKEEKARKEQDWKLYNNLKANFNTLIGKAKNKVSSQDEMQRLENELAKMQKVHAFDNI